jgi:DDE superfamily endonuclease
MPKSWTSSPERLEQLGVPEGYRQERTTGPIALDVLDQVRDEQLLPGDLVITDAGSGVSQPVREGLEQRQVFSIAGVTSEMVVGTEEPRWVRPGPSTRGRPPSNPPLADDSPRPVSLKLLAERLPRGTVTWREGTQGKLAAKCAGVRVWPAQDWGRGGCAGADPIGLLIEERADGTIP